MNQDKFWIVLGGGDVWPPHFAYAGDAERVARKEAAAHPGTPYYVLEAVSVALTPVVVPELLPLAGEGKQRSLLVTDGTPVSLEGIPSPDPEKK